MLVLLKILRSLTYNNSIVTIRIVTAASTFRLVRKRHVFVILFGYGRVGVITRRFHELVLRIQNIYVLQVLT